MEATRTRYKFRTKEEMEFKGFVRTTFDIGNKNTIAYVRDTEGKQENTAYTHVRDLYTLYVCPTATCYYIIIIPEGRVGEQASRNFESWSQSLPISSTHRLQTIFPLLPPSP